MTTKQMDVHEFAAAYWDMWIAPVNSKIPYAGPAEKKRLRKEVEQLKKDREKQIIEHYGKLP